MFINIPSSRNRCVGESEARDADFIMRPASSEKDADFFIDGGELPHHRVPDGGRTGLRILVPSSNFSQIKYDVIPYTLPYWVPGTFSGTVL